MSEAVGADFEINVDLNGVQEWDGESAPLIDPGVYVLQIVDAELGSSKTANQPVMKMQFEVMNEGAWLGTKFRRSYSLQPKALGRFKQLVVACGAPLTGAKKEHFVGAYIQAEIVHRLGQPQVQADGSMGEAKMQMDVIKEQPLPEDGADTSAADAAAAEAEAKAKAEAEAKAAAEAAAKAKATTPANGAAPRAAPRRAAAATAKA
jgi:hypothetical protein